MDIIFLLSIINLIFVAENPRYIHEKKNVHLLFSEIVSSGDKNSFIHTTRMTSYRKTDRQTKKVSWKAVTHSGQKDFIAVILI